MYEGAEPLPPGQALMMEKEGPWETSPAGETASSAIPRCTVVFGLLWRESWGRCAAGGILWNIQFSDEVSLEIVPGCTHIIKTVEGASPQPPFLGLRPSRVRKKYPVCCTRHLAWFLILSGSQTLIMCVHPGTISNENSRRR